MAEQVGHNVVTGSQSASASALADAATNQTHTAPAIGGSQPTLLGASQPTLLGAKDVPEQTPSIESHTSDPTTSSTDAHSAPQRPAEPSAGDAERRATESAAPNGQDTSASATIRREAALLTADGAVEDGRITPDISVHSDTDTSRADGAEQGKDPHHSRTNSVKKPTTFSKVSVTKNFLAKSVTPVQAAARVTEKPAPVGTPTIPVAKPRLVAKTGSALQNTSKVGLTSGGSTGPDASKVWNRNRPAAPPPPPKTLTDEQLKQQYGIHLATRLQTDDNGKEAKWADIDDDEDDWAPETVVWMDGTKSTLTPAADNAVLAPPELQQKQGPPQASDLPASHQNSDQPLKPALVSKAAPRPTGPPKTILKPGNAAQLAKLGGSPSTTPVNDRSSLKAKSPAPAPSKSPWAPLPPVESVSPIHPPTQQAPAPAVLPPQDARAYEPAQPQPTREIAADSFDRSWREGEGGQRELFNSANGRYEPAGDARRGSMRAERKPSVLQRPAYMDSAIAEPMAPYQARSGGMNDGSYARRRGSSISQASHPSIRRTSMSKGSDLGPASERQGSATSGPDPSNPPPTARVGPNFTQQTPWDAQMPVRPEDGAPAVPAEDPVKVQERVMREKRELAIKRRKDEEERQEAEKQERLKARLAALEGAGKSRKEREAEAAAVTPAAAEKDAQAPLVTPSAPVEAHVQAAVQEAIESAPGFHQQVLPEQVPVALPNKPSAESLPERTSMAVDPAQRQAQRSHLSPSATAPFNQPPAQQRQVSSSYSSPGDRKAQPFERSPLANSGPFSPWGPPPSNGNVWGSSGIGNGTFEKASSFATRPLQGLPIPPGSFPPGASRVSPQGQGQESHSPSLQASQVTEPLRGLAPPGIGSIPDGNWGPGRNNGVASGPGMGRQPHVPGPIAPPSRAQPGAQTDANRSREAVSAWNRAAQSLALEHSTSEHPRKETVLGIADGTMKATFKQTARNQSLTGPRRLEKTEYMVTDAQGTRHVSSHNPMPPSAQTQPAGPFSTSTIPEQKKLIGENTVRIPDGSRNPAHGGLPVQQPPIAPPSSVSRALSASPGNIHFATGPLAPAPPPVDVCPPPPEASSNITASSRPTVRLPPPPPVVKLPPALAQTQHAMAAAPPPQRHQPWGPPGSNRPLAQNPDWQARFNGLFNRTPIQTEVPPSPPRTPPKSQGVALAVASSSKSSLENSSLAATVSLPLGKVVVTVEGFAVDESADVISKPTIEPVFYEELSFGSLPKISIPRHVSYNVDMFETPKSNMLKMAVNSKMIREVEVQTRVPAIEIRPPLYYKSPDAYFLRIPGTRLENKPVHYESKEGRSHGRGTRQPWSKNPKVVKGKHSEVEGGGKESPRKASGYSDSRPKTGEVSTRPRSNYPKKIRGPSAATAAE